MTAGSSTGKASADSGTTEPSAHPAKHSAADAAPDALTLLENALAGVLAATPAIPVAANASMVAAGSSTSSQSSQSAGAQSASPAPGTQLLEILAADANASASTAAPSAATPTAPTAAAGAPSAGQPPAAATPTAAPSAATVGAVTAALTAAQLTAGTHVASRTTSDPKSLTLSSPVGSSAWTDELGAKVTWLAHQGIESASLQLSPEHLGPVQVSISVHNGQASVWFGATQPETRTALQQSLPQLRQLFSNQGLTLADAGVSRESPRGQSHQTPARGAAPVAAVSGLDSSPARVELVGGVGLVDTYV